MKIETMTITIEKYCSMDVNGEGLCLGCGTLIEGVESDARDYECPVCGQGKVLGAGELLIEGLVG